jgi:hypothetical protein
MSRPTQFTFPLPLSLYLYTDTDTETQTPYALTLIARPSLVRWLAWSLTSSSLPAISVESPRVSRSARVEEPVLVAVAAVASAASSASGSCRPWAGRYVTLPLRAAARRCFWPASPARPRTPAMTWMQRRLGKGVSWCLVCRVGGVGAHLSSLAGMGYVTQVGSAFVSITPMVGMLLRAHSCSRT